MVSLGWVGVGAVVSDSESSCCGMICVLDASAAWMYNLDVQCRATDSSIWRRMAPKRLSTRVAEGRLPGSLSNMLRTTASIGSTARKTGSFRFLASCSSRAIHELTWPIFRSRWNEQSATPPPRPAVLFFAPRWCAKAVILRLQRCVKMSRVTAPRENMSDASGSVCRDCQVCTTAVFDRVPGSRAGSRTVEEELLEEPEELDEVMDGVYKIGRLTGVTTRLRALPLDPEDDEDSAKENRVGESGNPPMRMAVPWEVTDSARELSEWSTASSEPGPLENRVSLPGRDDG